MILTAFTAITFVGLGFGQDQTIPGSLTLNKGGDSRMTINPSLDLSNLNPGATSGGASITSRRYGHLVMDLYGNDNLDAFAVRTDTNFDGTLDKIPFLINSIGHVFIGNVKSNNFILLRDLGNNNEIRSYGKDLSIETRTANENVFIRTDNGVKTISTFQGNGNVGIGIENPKRRFHIDQLSGTDSGLQISQRGNSQEIFLHLADNSAGEYGYLHLGGNTKIRGNQQFSTFDGNVFFEKNVGIGTTSPDEKLTVKGKIHAEEVRVDLSVPADYVFEKYYTGESQLKVDYVMPTLEEVEAFTKANNHLPSIPSAQEIKEEGLHLKEMTNLLLQKIEELTLYTIEQQKQLQAQQQEIQELKKKVN